MHVSLLVRQREENYEICIYEGKKKFVWNEMALKVEIRFLQLSMKKDVRMASHIFAIIIGKQFFSINKYEMKYKKKNIATQKRN